MSLLLVSIKIANYSIITSKDITVISFLFFFGLNSVHTNYLRLALGFCRGN